ncbi:unnamed protein product [Miscanthus lutarioriparius]|uniref:F-box domain-containing protein n=1 Tax=Miscanthus lutarioriparius TaxID=422564 RepID=A0A811NQT4_9POAL|nr:unnamed protein product [Miscanthus lutarioriparius]
MLPTGDSHAQPLPAPAVRQLDDLPSDILYKLLAGLPAGDVVRMSVLSQAWISRWESVPDLEIVILARRRRSRARRPPSVPSEIDLDDRVRDWESAAGFLERCAARVRGVSIRGIPLRLFDRADGWVRTVAGKSPRSLSLALNMTALPSLFACNPGALADLKLVTCVLPPPPPAFAGFRVLTALDLDYVLFSGEKGWERLEAMISSAAPTLEKLRLANIGFEHGAAGGAIPGAWIIQASNLRWLELRLTMAGAGSWELGHQPKLDYANITLNAHEPRHYGSMLAALASVRELEIGNFGCATYQEMKTFHQMKIS